jgi:hypothetical protein
MGVECTGPPHYASKTHGSCRADGLLGLEIRNNTVSVVQIDNDTRRHAANRPAARTVPHTLTQPKFAGGGAAAARRGALTGLPATAIFGCSLLVAP